MSHVASYAAFGMRLECGFALPELAPSTASDCAVWRVEERTGEPPALAGSTLGIDTVYGSVGVRAVALTNALRLAFDDTGTFDVHAAERLIAWYPGPKPDPNAVRADLLGRVMALATHAVGGLALHASAVAIDDRAVAFVGAKHAGKSTLAMALVRGGARLITDDTLVLRFDERDDVWAAPGVQRVRLWDDSARALGAESRGSIGAKPTVEPLAAHQLQPTDIPLDSCYVLGSSDAIGGDRIHRLPLSPVRAAIACVGFSKLGNLAGGSEGAVLLDRAARLVRTVPVYAAQVRQGLDRLDETAAQVLAWHRSGRRPTGVGQ